MTPRFALGLRGQILLALGIAFIVSFPLLGVAAATLTQRARAEDRLADAEAAAHAFAAGLAGSRGPARTAFRRLADAVVGKGGIVGVEWNRSTGEPLVRGLVGQGRAVASEVPDRGRVQLWVRPPSSAQTAPLARLLLLYTAVTGGAILLLTYIVLTYLIVRPVAAMTRASERLASGARHVDVPARGGAEVSRLASAFNDMARQLRAERAALEARLGELERTTKELASAQDQVVRSARLASVGRLSAGVAHEIGNPLSAISGLVELCRDETLDPDEKQEFLGRVQRETERIHTIIRDLLDFARQEQGEDDASDGCDPVAVVEDAVHLVVPQKDLRSVTLERRFAEPLPRVKARPERLTQVTLNLLLNAADAIEGDGSIVVGLEEDDGEVLLSVEDTGPGIPPEVRSQLFEPFVTTKPTGQGTGLGLAVCHTLVERMGGRIEATDAPHGGARFVVHLPLAERREDA